MTVTDISFRETHLFSKLILDYIAQNEHVSEFCSYAPTSDEIEKIISGKQKETIDRNRLAEVIHRQYEHIPITEVLKNNIEKLKEQHAFCIVTAHQLNIFTGPLYYIYKIAQTISTCRQLKEKYPTYNFIPVYWMGSEDHDFEEINHISVYNKKNEWTDNQGGATGAYTTASLLPLIDEIESLLGKEPHAKELIELFRKSYSLSDLSKATRYLVNALFGQYGLVIVDGNDAALKHQYADIMKAELVHQHSYKLVKEQLEKLEAKGYQQQAAPRAINLFYLSKNSRERIVYEHSKFSIQNSDLVFSESEILQELQTHPERFSPNVILRPLYQQKILPALAYIGGAGELAYWLQLKPVFEFYNVNFPQLLLRNSALLFSEAQAAKTEKLGFAVADLFDDIEQLKKAFIEKHTEEDIHVDSYKNELESTFEKLKELTKTIDASLVNAVGAEMQKSLQSMDAIQKRLMKSLKQKNEVQLNQLEKIKTQLFPEHSLQERVENFAPYYAKYGSAFIEELIADFDVYNRQFLLIQYS